MLGSFELGCDDAVGIRETVLNGYKAENEICTYVCVRTLEAVFVSLGTINIHSDEERGMNIPEAQTAIAVPASEVFRLIPCSEDRASSFHLDTLHSAEWIIDANEVSAGSYHGPGLCTDSATSLLATLSPLLSKFPPLSEAATFNIEHCLISASH